MQTKDRLTLESIEVRAVSIPLRRPIVAKIGVYKEWPFLLIDVRTKEGITGRSYLEVYLKEAVRYIAPTILTWPNCSRAPRSRRSISIGKRWAGCISWADKA